MEFRAGDPVIHWNYGLGRVVRLEERELSGSKMLYYVIQIKDMTVWVPADANSGSRLRPPMPANGFKKMLTILSSPGDPLPDDRHKRKIQLIDLLKQGRPESFFRVIRDLLGFKQGRTLSDSDQALLRLTQSALIGEWGFALSITPAQAEQELQHLLMASSTKI
jgi:RNA polymerase-interacting CarD/CdnL/TRCF family regulator